MSEYQERHTVSRLVGAPPGYVGYEEGGQLTEAVRRKPYSVVLFDEIEKAHADVFNTLLQVLDDGRITDSQGRTVDFRNTVIIMTSNIGAEHLLGGFSGDIPPDVRDRVMAELRAHFRPEFLNRVDDIILFKRLSLDQIERIVDLQIDELRQRLQERRITWSSPRTHASSSPSAASTRSTAQGRCGATSPTRSRPASAGPCSKATSRRVGHPRRHPRRRTRGGARKGDGLVIIQCPNCGQNNRVPPDASGVPHCGKCKTACPG
jgi:hypothetical protein